MNAIDRARADLANDRAWKALDRIQGLMASRCDEEVLSLLGDIHFEMRNYPAAGAAWFAAGRTDDRAQRAIASWHERQGNDHARWNTLPRQARGLIHTPNVEHLHMSADNYVHEKWSDQWTERHRPTPRHRIIDWLMALIAISFFAYGVIGFVTILHWIWGFPL